MYTKYKIKRGPTVKMVRRSGCLRRIAARSIPLWLDSILCTRTESLLIIDR